MASYRMEKEQEAECPLVAESARTLDRSHLRWMKNSTFMHMVANFHMLCNQTSLTCEMVIPVIASSILIFSGHFPARHLWTFSMNLLISIPIE